MNLFEALAEGKELTFLREFKADCPEGEWEAVLEFTLDLSLGRRCYFKALEPEALRGSKYQLAVRKEDGFRPSPDSFDMSQAEDGSVFRLVTKPDPSSFGNWLKAEKVN